MPHCQFPLVERMECKPQINLKLAGKEAEPRIWGSWGAYSDCNATTGQRQREAPCLGGMPYCQFPLVERLACTPAEPPSVVLKSATSGTVTIWGAWGEFSDCNAHVRKRTRTAKCLAGAPHCYGPLIEHTKCY